MSQPVSPSSKPFNVVIIGGGVVGVCTAHYLASHPRAAERNVQITIVERAGIAAAASGKAGGFLALDWADHTPYGPLSRLSFALHANLAAELGGETHYGYRTVDTLAVSATAQESAFSEPPVPWLDGKHVGRSSVIGNPTTTAQVHPYCFTHTLLDRALATGRVQILLGYRACGLRYLDGHIARAQADNDAAAGGGQGGGWLAWLTGSASASGASGASAAAASPATPAGPTTRSQARAMHAPPARVTGVAVRASGDTAPSTTRAVSAAGDPDNPEAGGSSAGAGDGAGAGAASCDSLDQAHEATLSATAQAQAHARAVSGSHHFAGSSDHPDHPDGEQVLDADVVVVAMGPWAGDVKGWLPEEVRWPEKTYGHRSHSIILRPQDPVTATALFIDFHDGNTSHEPELYPRPDGNVYMCGMSDPTPLPPSPVHAQAQPAAASCNKLREVAGKLSRELRGAVEHKRQCCWLPVVGDRPLIGWAPGVDGVAVGCGHAVWGILNAPATGKVLSELILDGKVASVDASGFMEEGGKMWSKGWNKNDRG